MRSENDAVRAALYASEAFYVSSAGFAVAGEDFDIWSAIVSGSAAEAPFESKVGADFPHVLFVRIC